MSDPVQPITPEERELLLARAQTGDSLGEHSRLLITKLDVFATAETERADEMQERLEEPVYGYDEFIREAREATARAAKLAEFKAYVHRRLDEAGVPADPESPHRAEGCRIGGRLDWLLARAGLAQA